ncbi:Ethylene-responsive transcription factor 9 [Triticum urartu]|uniref:Ethylene-responsive transcription factor 9 n=1 Tax=Triticum urartu TaxID=4572 RepID=M7ZMC7_TRIUA|nr:Ethylene-responsive transcription factor 9 [Triticum urartu]
MADGRGGGDVSITVCHQCGRQLFLGAFDTAEEAAGAYDAEAVRMRGAKAKTNLKQQPTARKKAAAARTGAGTKFRGVHRKPSGKYAAQIRHAGESSRWLGLEDAARAYDAAAVKLHGVKAITNFKQPPMAAAVDDGGESPMDHNDVPELRGVTAKTNLNQPPMVAGSADGGEESRMDLADNDFPEQPALDLFSGTITADAQLEDVFADLPPLDLQQVDELLMDMDFANMMA